MGALKAAVLRGLREWKSPPWYGEPLSLQTIMEWATTSDDYPSQVEIATGKKDATDAIERLADVIVAELKKD